MKLSHITEARYASPVKRAFEAFERYEQFVNEFEDPDAHIGITDDITIIERDYAETAGANFASMYLWVRNVDGEEEVVFKVKEFADRFNLPYTNITPSRRGDRFYAATMYFKESLKSITEARYKSRISSDDVDGVFKLYKKHEHEVDDTRLGHIAINAKWYPAGDRSVLQLNVGSEARLSFYFSRRPNAVPERTAMKWVKDYVAMYKLPYTDINPTPGRPLPFIDVTFLP